MKFWKYFCYGYAIIGTVGLLLFGFFFLGILLSDFIPLRYDVINGIVILVLLLISGILAVWKDDDLRRK